MTAPQTLPLRCWAEIDLAALERNIKLIRRALPARIKFVAVVKADAYGHGLHAMVGRLMHSGADMFAVANIGEAAAVREIGPGWPILLLSPVLPDEAEHVLDYDLIPTVSSHDEVDRFDALGARAGRPVPVHMKIDTGMGRAGIWHEQAPDLYRHIESAANVRLDGIFTHFSCADSDAGYTEYQRTVFLQALERLSGLDTARILIHTDNSAGLESFSESSPVNAVRVGLLQFGILPYENSILSRVATQPVFSFHTRVGLVKQLPAGTGISYGKTFTLQRDSTVAILTAGYGDGIPRACSNRASVLIKGFRCPILGRVTMDQTIVDITDAPRGIAPGEQATMVGRQDKGEINISEFSQWSDTIPWETLTSVTKRVPRLYRTALGL